MAGGATGNPGSPAVKGPEAFATRFDVSRETIEKLVTYEALLKQWQNAVNLVAASTLDQIWQRHFTDSAQLLEQIPPDARRLADLGSGAGFPGLVLAILLADAGRNQSVAITLIESDQRKAAFLREVVRSVDIPVDIVSTRIEHSATLEAIRCVDVVTARALARLQRLFELSIPLVGPDTVCLFLKGRGAIAEIEEARRGFTFESALLQSQTDPEARLVVVRHLAVRRKGEP